MFPRDFEIKRINSSIFWDITPPSPLKINQRFGGTCRLHLQSGKISQERSNLEAGSKQNFNPEDVGDMFSRNVR
jgi:hypothetical protein